MSSWCSVYTVSKAVVRFPLEANKKYEYLMLCIKYIAFARNFVRVEVENCSNRNLTG